jgi:hypothetical protein
MIRLLSLSGLVLLYLTVFIKVSWGIAGIKYPGAEAANDPADFKILKSNLTDFLDIIDFQLLKMTPNQRGTAPLAGGRIIKIPVERPIEDLFAAYGDAFLHLSLPTDLKQYEEAINQRLFLEYELTLRLTGFDVPLILKCLEVAYVLNFHNTRYLAKSQEIIDAESKLSPELKTKLNEYADLRVFCERSKAKGIPDDQNPYFAKLSQLDKELSAAPTETENPIDFVKLKEFYSASKTQFYKDIMHPIEFFQSLKASFEATHKPLFDLVNGIPSESNPEKVIKQVREYASLYRLANYARAPEGVGIKKMSLFLETKLELLREELSELKIDLEFQVYGVSLPPPVQTPVPVPPPTDPAKPGPEGTGPPKPEDTGTPKPPADQLPPPTGAAEIPKLKLENVITDIMREAVTFIFKIDRFSIPEILPNVAPKVLPKGADPTKTPPETLKKAPDTTKTTQPQPDVDQTEDLGKKQQQKDLPPAPLRTTTERKPKASKKDGGNKFNPYVVFFTIAAILLLFLGGLIVLLIMMNKIEPKVEESVAPATEKV